MHGIFLPLLSNCLQTLCHTAEPPADIDRNPSVDGITLPNRPQMLTPECELNHLEGVTVPRRMQTLPLHLPIFIQFFNMSRPGPNSGEDAGNSRFEPTDKHPRSEGWDPATVPGASEPRQSRGREARVRNMAEDARMTKCHVRLLTRPGERPLAAGPAYRTLEMVQRFFTLRRTRSFLILAPGGPQSSTPGSLLIPVLQMRHA